MALYLLCLMGLALAIQPSHAQSSQQDYLNAHNVARAQVGVANVTWDSAVQAYAQSYADSRKGDCNLVHSNSSGLYGENLSKGTGSFSGTAAVNLSEKPNYNYSSNACVGGHQCLHYTQVVWRETVKLGCARVLCNNGWYFVTCNYSPPGNYVGEKPY